MDEILREARSDRLMPGAGEIDLAGVLARLPDRPLSLEIPCDRLRDSGVGAGERAHMAIKATRDILEKSG
jgi:sugar phosphate isomerase/epimerase